MSREKEMTNRKKGRKGSTIPQELIDRIRKVSAENPDLSFTDLGKRFSLNYKTIGMILRKLGSYKNM